MGTTLDADGEEAFTVFWSHATSAGLAAVDHGELQSEIPEPSLGEQLIVVESFHSYSPLFEVGITAQQFHYLVASRPRYVPQVLWADT